MYSILTPRSPRWLPDGFAEALVAAVLSLGSLSLGALPGDANAALGAPTLKWSRCWPGTWCETGWYSSPAVADIDGDGQVEVLWGGYTLMAVNGATGEVEWHASSPGGSRLWPSIVIADLDGDGSQETVTADGAGYIAVYTGSGASYSGWPVRPTGTGNEIRSLAVADLDGNGDKEIVVCSTRADNQWFVYEHTGALRPGWPKMTDSDANGYAAGCYNENVGVAALDGYGRGEIIGPNDTHYTAAFNDDGSPLRANAVYGTAGGQTKPWARVGVHVDHGVDLRGYANCGTEHRPNFAASAPSIADMNGDGVPEIVIVGNVYNCGTSPYTDLYEMPFIFKADRTRWSGNGFDWTAIPAPDAKAAPLSEDYNIIENSQPNPVLADLDGDGFKEILYPSYDGRLHAYWLDKTEKYNWPFAVTTGGAYRFASEPLVADLDGDGKAEVVFTTWTQKGSNQRGELKILSWQGTQLFSVPLPPTGASSGGALPAPTLASIDGDADLEVLIGSTHAGLLAYDLPGTANANVLWGTGRGSYQRTGAVLGNASAGSLITRYYQTILGRLPDSGGFGFWQGEIARVQGLGIDVKEAFRVMAGLYFYSPEYLGRGTSDGQYVTDLYRTFFNRVPDGGGQAFWLGQLAAGMPRAVALFDFLFSAEFTTYMNGLLGNTSSRPEVSAVVDFYRGFLNRLPDSPGFNYWLGRFRAAQCQGAAAVNAEVESISGQFAGSAEYLGRNRSNRDFVADLYYAFLRRGGDLAGFNFWLGQIDSGTRSREQLRQAFLRSDEFQGLVQQIINRGCLN